MHLGGAAATNMYAVDLHSMTQANVVNGNTRKIRRRAPAAVWQFEDGKPNSEEWKPYGFLSAARAEYEYVANPMVQYTVAVTHHKTHQSKLELDLGKMVQMNLKTKVRRRIRRVVNQQSFC